jgi:molybdenum cofactor cytidylyltransferase
LEEVVSNLLAARLNPVVVVCGFQREAIEAALSHLSVQCIHNPQYESGEMLSSVQVGLASLTNTCQGALLALADQPQMQVAVAHQLIRTFQESSSRALVVPSYRMRGGHPVILPRWLWPEILALAPADTLRSVFQRHRRRIQYVVVDTPTILADIDTPEQYQAALN